MATFLFAVGFLGIFFGVALGYQANKIPNTVTYQASEVANLQLMHLQQLNMAVAIGLVIAGAIFFVGGAVVYALQSRPKAD